MKASELICPVCGMNGKLVDVSEVHDGRSGAWVYVCMGYPGCDHYVGCHPGTKEPLGTLAGVELRRLRMVAHNALDWAWRSGRMSRTEAYGIVCEHLGIDKEQAHIGMMNEDQCRQVVALFNAMRPWKTPKGV